MRLSVRLAMAVTLTDSRHAHLYLQAGIRLIIPFLKSVMSFGRQVYVVLWSTVV